MATAAAMRQPAPPAERLHRALSAIERTALRLVMAELPALDDLVVTSELAVRNGLPKSSFTTALYKAHSAGVVDVTGRGRAGTQVIILDGPALEAAVRE